MRAVIAEMPERWLWERENSEAAQWDEMWNGVLHMPPMPNRMHQNIAAELHFYLRVNLAKPRGWRVHQEVNVTTLADEERWTFNYRIPDLVVLDPTRFQIDKNEYMAGAPLVVVEISSPGDDTNDKLQFYAELGVPEVWVIGRDSRAPQIQRLEAGPTYAPVTPGRDGWIHSPATGVEFRQTRPGRVWVRIDGSEARAEELPEN